jgi:hydrogenase maturation protein HypF
LCGEVRNRLGTVQITVQGQTSALDAFQDRLISDAPPLAHPNICKIAVVASIAYDDFQIQTSLVSDNARVFVPPDFFLCQDCAAEQSDPNDRRYRYAFINCTQCGPRYTLINSLPYDRLNTSMADFELCPDCLAEYTNPGDRRFHAEPIACPTCGPQISFELQGQPGSAEKDAALAAALSQLRAGNIVAVKGIGGYHLMCDASNTTAVATLRQRKHRPDKPLAVMFPYVGDDGLDAVRESLDLNENQAALLTDPIRPIVLAAKRADCELAENLAPGLDELGVFLPYSPLHQLLLSEFGSPLVASSGNISGEPVLTDNNEARIRLAAIADAFLHHDRPIVRPADDPVYRSISGVMRPLRLGRGVAPLEIELPYRQAEPVLCVGGHMKTTVTLSWENRAVVSPHIGEMDSPRSLAVFERVLTDLQDLYGVQATRIICDAHNGYATNLWARRQDRLPVTPIWHHHAHASALTGEVGAPGPWLVFTWDGVGLGEDGTLWGGEALFGDTGNWHRVCSLRPFRPPGGDRAGREPWRSAAAMFWETGIDQLSDDFDYEFARQAWQKNVNCPQTSAAGRLFDAAAAIVCGTIKVSFEAQGPMQFEALCHKAGSAISLPMYEDDAGILRSDWEPVLRHLADANLDVVERAEDFHSSMAKIIVDQAVAVRERNDFHQVGLAGGVFQNRLLTEQAIAMLSAAGFDVHMNTILPCNDAALSFGQAAEWAAFCQLGCKDGRREDLSGTR